MLCLERLVVRARVLLFLLITFSNTLTNASWFDDVAQNLLREELKITESKRDSGLYTADDLLLDVQYESTGQVNKIVSLESEVKDVVISNLDSSYSKFKMRVDYNNGSNEYVYGRYNVCIEAPVTARVIKVGEIITNTDIAFTKVKLSRLGEKFLLNYDSVIGMQVKRPLLAGSLIRSTDLIKPVVIKVNDPISITYKSSSIQLKTSGVAVNNGGIGDMIKVKNNDTGAVILGQIVDRNNVRVGFSE